MDIGYFDSNCNLIPPLRGLRDRDALRAGLADGTIDAICSDHTPVDDDAKQVPFAEAEPGATGLELLLPLTLKWAREARLPLAGGAGTGHYRIRFACSGLPGAGNHRRADRRPVRVRPRSLVAGGARSLAQPGQEHAVARAWSCKAACATRWWAARSSLNPHRSPLCASYDITALLECGPQPCMCRALGSTPFNSMNPLLDFSTFPRFAEIQARARHAGRGSVAAGQSRLGRTRCDRRREQPTWDSFVAPLDDANERLARAWGQVAHLNAVMNSPPLRETYNANLPKISQYYTELSQDERLYAKFKALRAAPEFDRLDREQRKIVDNELRDFRLGGAELLAGSEGRVQAGARAARQALLALQRQPAGCDQRFRPLRHRPRRADWDSRRCGGGGARRSPAGRQGGLEVHAAHAVLSAGHAIRRQSRPARVDVSSLRNAGSGVRQCRLEQHAAHRARS